MLGALQEAIIPLSADEPDIHRMVYQTKHPQQRHPVNYRLPFIDETESLAFKTILVFWA